MNERQKKNLDKLIAYVESLPKGYKRFDMGVFCEKEGIGELPPKQASEAIHTCGTSACFLGHGPAAGIPAERGEGWWEYMTRQFGVYPYDYDSEITDAAAWLFSPGWQGRHGTKAAAVKRAKEFVAAGYKVTNDMRKKLDRLTTGF